MMKTEVQFLTTFFEYLNGHATYAVLRNYEGLPAKNDSRDIDIVLEQTTYRNIKNDLIGFHIL